MENDDPYADGAPSANPMPKENEADKETSDNKTELLSNSFFPGGDPEVGSVCKVRVVQKMQDQVAVEYVDEGEEGKEKAPMEASPAAAGGPPMGESNYE